jgi:GT2 family glycosyltransferase
MTDTCTPILDAALIIPSYNRADLISETLASALAQSLPFSEIIVVDDGSTDHTAKVLATFGDKIRCISSPNQGVQAARNLGIAHCRSPVLVFLDSDDLLEPDYLAKVLPWMSAHPIIDAVYTNFRTFTATQSEPDKLSRCLFDFTAGAFTDGVFRTGIPDLYLRSLRFQPLFTCGLMVRRTFIAQHGGYDPSFKGVGAEDWEFTLRVISEGELALCTAPLAKVRKHGSNDSRSNRHMSLGEVQVLSHSLAHHKGAHQHAQAIHDTMQRRLLDALNTAFDDQAFDQVLAIAKRLPPALPLKARAKVLIAGLPTPLNRWLWSWVQA